MGNVVGELTGANRAAARAAGSAARQQQAAAGELYDFAQEQYKNALKEAKNPQDLARIQNALNAQDREVARQEKLAQAIDPAILEASQQALNLLQGKESSTLQPLRADRQRQRQTLLNSLREQLGPGAESSAAGLKAISQFDAQTEQLLAGQQQSSLAQLLGVGLSGSQASGVGRASGQSLQGLFGRQDAATAPMRSLLPTVIGAGGGTVQTAGANQVYNQIRAGQNQQLGGDLAQAAYTGAALFAGGGGMGMSPGGFSMANLGQTMFGFGQKGNQAGQSNYNASSVA